MEKIGFFMAGACCSAFLAALLVSADKLSSTENSVRKDILSVEEYVVERGNCKKHNMQPMVVKNGNNQVVQVLCSTGSEILKAK